MAAANAGIVPVTDLTHEGEVKMLPARHALAALCAVFLLALSGCVTLPPNSQRVPQDPWESWNRGVYKVNDKLDRAIAKPVTKAYVRVVPHPIRTGVTNFFANSRSRHPGGTGPQ
jgi:phospholipid-binding lipoprotein MlaA